MGQVGQHEPVPVTRNLSQMDFDADNSPGKPAVSIGEEAALLLALKTPPRIVNETQPRIVNSGYVFAQYLSLPMNQKKSVVHSIFRISSIISL